MMQVPDAPWIRNAERYGTAYRDAWVWGYGDDDDYSDYENLLSSLSFGKRKFGRK